MKKFIGKVLYFIYDGIARMNEFFGRYHIISEKAMWTNISNSVDGMDFAVRRLMGRDSYRRYGSSFRRSVTGSPNFREIYMLFYGIKQNFMEVCEMDQEYVDGLLDVTGEIARDEGMKNRFFDIVITRTMERFGCTAEEAFEFFGEVFSEAYGDALANLENFE